MLKRGDIMAPDVLAVEAIGRVTEKDCGTTLTPLAGKMMTKGPIRLR